MTPVYGNSPPTQHRQPLVTWEELPSQPPRPYPRPPPSLFLPRQETETDSTQEQEPRQPARPVRRHLPPELYLRSVRVPTVHAHVSTCYTAGITVSYCCIPVAIAIAASLPSTLHQCTLLLTTRAGQMWDPSWIPQSSLSSHLSTCDQLQLDNSLHLQTWKKQRNCTNGILAMKSFNQSA